MNYSWLCNRRTLTFCWFLPTASLMSYSGNEGNFPRCKHKTDRSNLGPVIDWGNEEAGFQTTLSTKDAGLSTRGTLQLSESRDHRAYPRRRPIRDATRPNRGPILPYLRKDWTPDVQATGPSIPQTRTSWDWGLRGIEDFVGLMTSWDSGFRGIQDFVRSRTSQDLGLRGI